MDNILLATEFQDQCEVFTVDLLNFLADRGYHISRTKAQLVQETVRFLGHDLTQYKRHLALERINALLRIPTPKTPVELVWKLKLCLASPPALQLPDPEGAYKLFIDEEQGVAKGILVQLLSGAPAVTGYLSKNLDVSARGWPACL